MRRSAVLSVLCNVSALSLAWPVAGKCLSSQAESQQSTHSSGGTACWPLLFAVHPAKCTKRKLRIEHNQDLAQKVGRSKRKRQQAFINISFNLKRKRKSKEDRDDDPPQEVKKTAKQSVQKDEVKKEIGFLSL